jgi:hypothetical protein
VNVGIAARRTKGEMYVPSVLPASGISEQESRSALVAGTLRSDGLYSAYYGHQCVHLQNSNVQ